MCILNLDRFSCGHTRVVFTDECDDAPSCDVQDERFNDRGSWKCPACRAEVKKRVEEQKLKRKRSGRKRGGT